VTCPLIQYARRAMIASMTLLAHPPRPGWLSTITDARPSLQGAIEQQKVTLNSAFLGDDAWLPPNDRYHFLFLSATNIRVSP